MKFITGWSPKLRGDNLKAAQKKFTALFQPTDKVPLADKVESVVRQCVICDKVNEEGPEKTIAFSAINTKPIAQGEKLISTVSHVRCAHEITEREALACHEVIRKVVDSFKAIHGTTDYVQIQESGTAAGQFGNHFYSRIYPSPTKNAYWHQLRALVRYVRGKLL